MVQLVTWDWNGTLLADTQMLIDASNHLIETYGGTRISRKQYVAEFDFPVIDFYVNQGCRKAVGGRKAAKLFHKSYEKKATRAHTRRGARKVLDWLKSNSIDSVILSNHMQEAITTQLQRLNLQEYFGEVLANTDIADTQYGKNKIERIIDYISRTTYNPADGIIVGDSPEDIGIGKELGMETIALTDGYFSTPKLRASKPDHLISNLTEMIGILGKH